MKILHPASWAVLFLMLFVAGGCNQDSDPEVTPPAEVAVSLYLNMFTAELFVGDTLEIEGWVTVFDETDAPVPDAEVALTLEKNNGCLAVLGSESRTDVNGELHFVYTVRGSDGPCAQRIHARFGTEDEEWPLGIIVPDWWVADVALTVTPDTLRLIANVDSTFIVHVSVADSAGHAMSGIPVEFSNQNSQGLWQAQDEWDEFATNSNGQTNNTFSVRSPGVFGVAVRAGFVSDTIRCVVLLEE